jgi:hypothetical protein
MVFMLMAMAFFSACGGGSGTSDNTPGKTSITGVVSFPVTTERVGTAKRTAATVSDSSVTVEAYTLDGVLVPAASVHPTYDDTVATRIYSYAIPNLAANVDYIIKAKKGSVVLKKLIASKDMVAGSVADQTVNAVSTAAVVVASQKLSTATVNVVLGDTLPTGKTVAGLSADIGTSVKPALLEQSIAAAIGGSMANITTADSANFANVFNIVVTAVAEDKDPALVFAGTSTLTGGVPIFQVSGEVVTPPSTDSTTWSIPTATAIAEISSATVATYVPPTESAKTYTDLADKYLAAQDISNAALNYEKALTIDATDKKANFGGAITSGLMLMEDSDVKSIVAKWGGALPTVNQMVQGTSPVKLPFLNMTSGGSAVSSILPKTTAKAVASTNSARNVLAAFKTLQAKLPQQKSGFKSMAKELALVPTTAPTVSEMQALIDNVIVPRIDKILARLAMAEGNGFTFTITKAMKGNPLYGTDTILDDGEFYTLDAALNLFQTLFKIVTAYNFDIPAPYDYNTIGQDPLALINNASFFTLKADGGTKMNAALAYARVAAAKAATAFDILKVRAAGAGAFDLSTWALTEKTAFSNDLGDITKALAGETTLTIGGKSLTIDATKFFTNPLTKAKLPTFGYDVPRDATLSLKYDSAVAGEQSNSYQMWDGTTSVTQTRTDSIDCSIVPKSDLPDYTLNGILPGNTATNNVAGFNGILPVLDGKLLSGAALGYGYDYATDGTSAYFINQNGGTNTASGYSYVVQKINLTTGAVSKHADLSTSGGGRLFFSNGVFYLATMEGTASGNTLNIYPLNTATSTWSLGALAYHGTFTGYPWLSAISASGTDIYYAMNSWNSLTYSSTTEVRKLSNLTSDALLFTTSDYIYQMAFSNGSLFVSDGGELAKMDLTGTVLATYINGGMNIMADGYLYEIYNNKLIKKGGTPAGGAAKLINTLGTSL